MKITKKAVRQFVKNELGTNKTWALKALTKVLEKQTESEQNMETTTDANGVGFSGFDGEIMTSIAKQYIRKGYLSNKQMTIVFKKMPKYWNQILKVSDIDKINQLILKNQS